MEAGLRCVRADEIAHAAVIDLPLYEYLLSADVVIADISTGNANAVYELGMCHALRPRGTIVIAEQGFRSPFDSSSMPILAYEHLGKDLGLREAKRLKQELKKALQVALCFRGDNQPPVYLSSGFEAPGARADCRAAALVRERICLPANQRLDTGDVVLPQLCLMRTRGSLTRLAPASFFVLRTKSSNVVLRSRNRDPVLPTAGRCLEVAPEYLPRPLKEYGGQWHCGSTSILVSDRD